MPKWPAATKYTHAHTSIQFNAQTDAANRLVKLTDITHDSER